MTRLSRLCFLPFWAVFAPFHLAADVPVRVDQYGDPLPALALARLGTVRFRQGNGIRCLVYSPDGKVLASGGPGGRIVLWDPQSGRGIRELEGTRVTVMDLAFSPDSKRIVVATGQRGVRGLTRDLQLLDVTTGKLLFQMPETIGGTNYLAFSPDGKTFASAHSMNCVNLWDVQTQELLRHWESRYFRVQIRSIAFAPDGRTLFAMGSDGNIQFFDLPTGKEFTRQGNPFGCRCAAFSPNGAIVATDGRPGLRLYRTQTMDEIHRLEGHQGEVAAMAFSPDGNNLVSCGEDQTIRFWQVASGKQLWEIPKQEQPCSVIAISPDGKTVASATGYGGGVIHLWDAKTGKARPSWGTHLREVNQVGFLRDGETVASIWANSHGVVWPHGTGIESRPIQMPLGSNHCLLGSDRSTLAVTTPEGALVLVDLHSGRELFRWPVAKDFAVVALSADNKRAVVQERSLPLQVWDLPTKKAIHCFEPGMCFLALSQDGRMIAGSSRQQILLWNLDTNKEVGRCGYSEHGLWSAAAFSPDGRMIATCNYGHTVQLSETATGKERLLLQGHLGHISSLIFSTDGRTLVSGSADSTMRLWNIREGKELQVFPGHLGKVISVNFSPDGRRLVSGSQDTSALVWKIPAACRERKTDLVHLGNQARNQLWTKLCDENASTAYGALQRLAADVETVSLCRDKLLTPATPPDQVQRWIVQLDDEEFTIREQASGNLERVEGDAEKALEKALKADSSPELRRRIEALLETLHGKQLTVRVLRAVELLEQIGTSEAVDVLRQLEKKTGNAAVRHDVRRTLDRLQAKQKAP